MITVETHPTPTALGHRAASLGADAIRTALATRNEARIVLATGSSQFSTLEALVAAPGIDWSRVTAFHLDEYIGLPPDHPASFRRYLRERFARHVPAARFIPVDGDADPEAEIARLSALITAAPIDVCFAGLGENCHLAFNDPPADLHTEAPYLHVSLDDACRRQQLGEGWFPHLDDVPRTALSMSIRQMGKSHLVILSVPDSRKAAAVRAMLLEPVSPATPGTALRNHPNAFLLLDPASAAGLAEAA